MQLEGRKVAVFGLAKSGLAAARLLRKHGARVTAVDARSEAQLGEAAASLRAAGVTLAVGGLRPRGSRGAGPGQRFGVPLALPELARARQAGVPVWGEVQLAGRFLTQVPLFGITGTNGKSTTTALTGELFRRAGARTFVGGNLGRPSARRPRRRRRGTRWWWS